MRPKPKCSNGCALTWHAPKALEGKNPWPRPLAQAVDPSWDPYHEKRITLGGLVDHLAAIRRGRRVMFVACGTSFHACLACRQTCEELAEVPVRGDPPHAAVQPSVLPLSSACPFSGSTVGGPPTSPARTLTPSAVSICPSRAAELGCRTAGAGHMGVAFSREAPCQAQPPWTLA